MCLPNEIIISFGRHMTLVWDQSTINVHSQHLAQLLCIIHNSYSKKPRLYHYILLETMDCKQRKAESTPLLPQKLFDGLGCSADMELLGLPNF